MKFENLAPETQNVLLNGGCFIVHAASNIHVATAEEMHQPNFPEFVMRCHACDRFLTEDDFDVIPVEVPKMLDVIDANARLTAAKELATRQYVNDVRSGLNGSAWAALLHLLEHGPRPGLTDENWDRFLTDLRNNAANTIAEERRQALVRIHGERF